MGNGLVTHFRSENRRVDLDPSEIRLKTFQQGTWLLLATVAAGVFNYLSSILVGRLLGPAEYGIFASMVSLLLILGVLTGVVQTVTTNYVARLRAMETTADVATFLLYLLKRLLPWGIGSALVLALLSRPLAALLHIPSVLPIIALGLVLIPTAVLPVAYGGLGGLQRFGALGVTQIMGSILRLITAVALVSLGLGAVGAVGSLSLSSLGALALGLLLLGDVLHQREPGARANVEGLFRHTFHTALAVMGFMLLTNSDLLIVKIRFTPAEAGLYSAVATLGKVTLWLSGAVVTLLLPKATEQYTHGRTTRGLVGRGLLAVGLLCGGLTLLFFLLPSRIMDAFFGEQYLPQASLLGPYGLAMTFYSLVSAWLYYYLAVEEKRYSYILVVGAAVQITVLLMAPLTLPLVIGTLIVTSVCLFVVGFWWVSK